ncbi:hypothetical protein Hypma_006027 [Hypsizygus marmoreus]|uniref:Uncharacterized protein n=1 Tax=Hypsizygus marmoreus TaxID=39966 RepID=A0A369K3W0_HYPMA|nr:hypothetical protein Hypma_006027 [Hypsizygus marmoreus]
MNLLLLTRSEVPLAYLWTEQEASDPRFTSLSPEYQAACWAYTDAHPALSRPLEVTFSDIPSLAEAFPQVPRYDEYYQSALDGYTEDASRWRLDKDAPDVYICNFIGWKCRPVMSTLRKTDYRQRFRFRAVMKGVENYILYWCYRPLPSDLDRIMIDVKLWEEPDMELREIYRHEYGPVGGKHFDQETGDLVESRNYVSLNSLRFKRMSVPAKAAKAEVATTSKEKARTQPYPKPISISSAETIDEPGPSSAASRADTRRNLSLASCISARQEEDSIPSAPSLATRISDSPPQANARQPETPVVPLSARLSDIAPVTAASGRTSPRKRSAQED